LGALKKKKKNNFLAKGTKEGALVFKYMKHTIQFFTISIINVIHSNPLHSPKITVDIYQKKVALPKKWADMST
jgi:hypothetical protein